MNPVKISITINQAQVVAMGLNVDIIDLALLDYCQNYLLSAKAKRTLVDGKVYVMVSPTDIINDMPLLGLTTSKSINNHIDSLIEAGLLERCPDNQKLRGTYICQGVRYDEYIGINAIPYAAPAPAPAAPAAVVVKKKPYEFDDLKLPHTEPRFIEWLDKLALEDVWKKKSRQAWVMAFNALAKYPEPIASTAIAICIDRKYRGIFPDSVKPEDVNRYLYPRGTAPAKTAASPGTRPVNIEDLM